jgi:lipopolysaccharide exporter
LQSVPAEKSSSISEPPRTLAKRAVIGAVWTISTSVGSRALGLIGTLLITRFLDPQVYGEYSLAAVVVMTATVLSNCGLSQYLVSKPKEGRAAAFHATFYFMLLGVISLGAVVILREQIGGWINTPGVVVYIPGLALAMLFERISTIQDRILVRDMRFQSVGLQRSMGDITYALVSVVLAWRGWGGAALIWATMARTSLRVFVLSLTTPWREWAEPCRITWQRTRDLFAFGLPMSVASLASFGSRRWDNLLIGRRFGEGTAGIYNLAYNLADIPASQIGETIGDVLVPSFAKMDSDSKRRRALLLSLRMLMLIVAPLAIGLGAIAPTLVKTCFDARWAGVADMLIVLSVLSVFRPIGWTGSSYLQVKDRPRHIMALEIFRTILLLTLIVVFQNLYRGVNFIGLPQVSDVLRLESHASLWACAAVGIAFAMDSIAYMWVIKGVDGIPLREQILPLLPPIVACLPMALSVIGVRHLIEGVALPNGVKLAIETLVGAIVFIPSAFVFAPASARDLIKLLKHALLRRRHRVSDLPEPPPPPDLIPPSAEPTGLAHTPGSASEPPPR